MSETRGTSDRQCSYVFSHNERCENPVYWKVQSSGFCQGHYTRQLRGKDMDKPFKRSAGEVVPLSGIKIRSEIQELLLAEGVKHGFGEYRMICKILEDRFTEYGSKGWKPPVEYRTTDRGNMIFSPVVRVSADTARAIKKEAFRSERSVYAFIQDCLEEWAKSVDANAGVVEVSG